MFIAHLPAGYLLTRRIEARRDASGLMPLGLAASVLPDTDLLWFYLVDHRRLLHHDYWTHAPFWWAIIAAAWYLRVLVVRRRVAGARSLVFFGNVFLHLMLDTVVGKVAWLAPFYHHQFALVTVPARHQWWVLSFVLHWTFGLELLVFAWAVAEAVRHPFAAPGEAKT